MSFSSPWFGLTGHKMSSTGTAAVSDEYGFLDYIPLKEYITFRDKPEVEILVRRLNMIVYVFLLKI